ncbi:uncharacterized protein LOC143301140 [Babylonia areolata]|uniref:uncharacterized protein LOC143301140 n=1 Tax=Babylonia areolata TaxID=304850 RepID=UPI003FD34B3A
MLLLQTGFFLFAFVATGTLANTCQEALYQCKADSQTSMVNICANLVSWLKCISGTGEEGTCSLEETNGVTFNSLLSVAKDNCDYFIPLSTVNPCLHLGNCVARETKFLTVVGDDISSIVNDTAKTGFWCSLMEGTLNCVIANADNCKYDKSTMSPITQQYEKTKRLCQGPAAGGAGTTTPDRMTLTTALLISLAALLLLPRVFSSCSSFSPSSSSSSYA